MQFVSSNTVSLTNIYTLDAGYFCIFISRLKHVPLFNFQISVYVKLYDKAASMHCLDGKARAGLMQWLDVESALNAFVLANHATVHTSSSKLPDTRVLTRLLSYNIASVAS